MCWIPYVVVHMRSLEPDNYINFYVYASMEILSDLTIAINPVLYISLYQPCKSALRHYHKMLLDRLHSLASRKTISEAKTSMQTTGEMTGDETTTQIAQLQLKNADTGHTMRDDTILITHHKTGSNCQEHATVRCCNLCDTTVTTINPSDTTVSINNPSGTTATIINSSDTTATINSCETALTTVNQCNSCDTLVNNYASCDTIASNSCDTTDQHGNSYDSCDSILTNCNSLDIKEATSNHSDTIKETLTNHSDMSNKQPHVLLINNPLDSSYLSETTASTVIFELCDNTETTVNDGGSHATTKPEFSGEPLDTHGIDACIVKNGGPEVVIDDTPDSYNTIEATPDVADTREASVKLDVTYGTSTSRVVVYL